MHIEIISMYYHVYIYIDIIYKYFKCINITYFIEYIHAYVYLYKYTQYTHIYCVNKNVYFECD